MSKGQIDASSVLWSVPGRRTEATLAAGVEER
jgi:hypothetical protein